MLSDISNLRIILLNSSERAASDTFFEFYEFLKILNKAFEIKRMQNWYFGLYTALYLNENTDGDSDDPIEDLYIICEKPPSRKRLIKLQDFNLKFGVVKNGFNYSDYEKTILDFILMWNANQKHTYKIIGEVKKYFNSASIQKIQKYVQYYPTSIKNIVQECIK